jgi:prepilin-type N-terminal cleavage/methylation domain-containing protein
MKFKNNDCLTLIELIVVILIISILSSSGLYKVNPDENPLTNPLLKSFTSSVRFYHSKLGSL